VPEIGGTKKRLGRSDRRTEGPGQGKKLAAERVHLDEKEVKLYRGKKTKKERH